ncbi:MAG TPA: type II secretion system protein [Verrucomicrobiae bacterium]
MRLPKPWRPCGLCATRAFTLTELLVVTGIIGVLAALLLPSISFGRSQARSAACRSRLRQMGLALQMYVTDHGNKYPSYIGFPDSSLGGAAGPLNARSWWAKLAPYYAAAISRP